MSNKRLSRKFKRSQIELEYIADLNKEEQMYKRLCKRVITYLCNTFERITIRIKQHKAESYGVSNLSVHFSETDITNSDDISYSAWESTYKEIYKQVIRFKFRKHFISEDMSSEEMDLQLAISGY